ncbi:hypothetical protein [Sulfurimonas sp. HSL3-7]|uniref:hypothetical protein n=1 Tax=Sulfonitrofixus jiaomeiensis TaxID=3131938 RepID=UPI0031F76384
MNSFIDIVVLTLFILFLFFIFRGYHQSKLEERENKNSENGPVQKGDTPIE